MILAASVQKSLIAFYFYILPVQCATMLMT